MTTKRHQPDFSAVTWEEIHQAMQSLSVTENEIRGSGFNFSPRPWSEGNETDKETVINALNSLVYASIHEYSPEVWGGPRRWSKWLDIPEDTRRFIIRTQSIETGSPADLPVDVDPWEKTTRDA